MRSSVIGFICSATLASACASAADFEPALSRPRLTIAVRFETSYSAGSLIQMRRELARILATAGVEVDWYTQEDTLRGRAATEIVVARFRGACDSAGVNRSVSRGRPPGTTPVAGTEVLPFPEIDCGELRVVLARKLDAEGPAAAERVLGQAMARVLAHEIYHVVLNTREHANRGIAKAELNAEDLARPLLSFEPEESGKIAAALRHTGRYDSGALLTGGE